MIIKHVSRKNTAGSDFARLTNYITDLVNGGRKVDYTQICNCLNTDYGLAQKEVLATQQMNKRAKSDKTYHMVISLQPGENLTKDQLCDIEARACDAIGLGAHQRFSAVHRDTDCLHIHIAINKIHPQTYNISEPYYDHLTLGQVCVEMEKKHGLKPLNRKSRGGKEQSSTETHSGIESFASWCAGDPQKALNRVLEKPETDWNDLHRCLARFNLEIRLRGRGIVFSDRDRRFFCKASTVSRALSKSRLEKRFGAWQPPSAEIREKKPQSRYLPEPLQKGSARKRLYKAYQEERNTTVLLKRELLDELAGQRKTRLESIRADFAARRFFVKNNPSLKVKGKKARYSLLKMERLATLEELKLDIAEKRAEIHNKHRLKTWQGFLIAKAEAGDEDALEVLRSRRRFKMPNDNFMSGPTDNRLFGNYSYSVSRNGVVTYRLKSGVMRDEGRRLRLADEHVNARNVEAAILMAQQKFGSRLEVRGSEAFKQQVIQTVRARQIKVTFKDAAMQRMLLAQQSNQPSRPAGEVDTLQVFIEQRNRTRLKVKNLLPHRKVKLDQDTGRLTYQGQRKLTDGVRVALLSNQKEMLVLRISASQAAKLKKIKLGKQMEIDKRGRFIKGRQR